MIKKVTKAHSHLEDGDESSSLNLNNSKEFAAIFSVP